VPEEPPYDVAAVRSEFPVVERVVYLNTGTAGVCPASVCAALWESTRAFEQGGEWYWGEADAGMEAARKRVARFLGATPDEIAFTRNATDGVNIVVEGVDWRDGDEVLLSDQEHPSMLFPWTYLTQRRNVRLRRFKVGMDDAETLASIRAAWTPRTRLLAASHVTSQTGTRLPARAVVELCHEGGALVLFDGAQAVGQIPVDVRRLGTDFYTGNLHKWLHGPKGTGFLYVAQERLGGLRPTWVGAGTGGFSDDGGLVPLDTSRRFEYGTRDFGKYGALVALFDWHDALGLDRSREHMRRLTDALRRGIADVPGARLHTPVSWTLSSALTTFSVEGVDAAALMRDLWESDRMRLRHVHEVNGVRVSAALFNTEEEVHRLIRGIGRCR
jgi:L-cysteine/cystine lyase